MARLRIDLDGLGGLRAELRRAGPRTERLAEQALRRIATAIQADAKRAAPVDTGALRNSISTSVTRHGGSVTAEVGPTVHYGGFVELGTSRRAPRPYVGPAFDRHAPEFVEALRTLAREIE